MRSKYTQFILLGNIAFLTAAGFSGAAAAQESGQTEFKRDQIIVTGTKREESVRDISGSISAVTEDSLKDLNAQSLSDYITRVPGVVFNDYQPGVSEVVIRGVASTTYHEANQATTGYYLNEIPLIEPGFPLVIPDIDAFDLERVEILRGPQGTLFGSSSLGGAVNYVVNEADLTGFDAAAETTLSSTKGADGEPGYAVKGMINVPIVEEKLAARVVALQRFDAGYLNNTTLNDNGSNDLRVRGLRGSIIFEPTPTTKISALSMYQEYDLDDQTYAIFGADPETYDRATNVREFQDTDIMLHSLTLDQDLGFATLTAVGSYTEKNSDLAFDDSIFVGGNDPRTDTPQLSSSFGTSETEYFEARLASPGTSKLNWIIGANYTKVDSDSTGAVFIEGIGDYIDANPSEFDGQPSSVIAPDDLTQRTVTNQQVKEMAVFGEVSYDITQALELTLGGRLFEYKSQPRLQFLPNADLTPSFDYQPEESSESDFIPKVSLTYEPTDDFMIYGLYSEGFRIGGANTYSLATPGLPLTFNSDTTSNYEIGTRIDLADDRILLDLTAFHVDWNDIQARLFTPVDFNAYTVNGGGADINGVEFSLTAALTDNLEVTSNIAYTDAELSSLLPDSSAPGGGYTDGTRLPGAAEWTISNTATYSFEQVKFSPSVGVAHRYLSEAPVAFGATLEKGDYHLFDLNASLQITDQIGASLFVKNVFNTYGILSAPFSFAGSVTRPRTAGVTLRYNLN